MDISRTFWVHIDTMNKARHSHACGVVNKDSILIAGGKDGIGNMLTSVEMFYLKEMEWHGSTPLPNPTTSEASLQYRNTVIIFGETAIFHFDETLFEWSLREETLSTERSEFLAIPITGMCIWAAQSNPNPQKLRLGKQSQCPVPRWFTGPWMCQTLKVLKFECVKLRK